MTTATDQRQDSAEESQSPYGCAAFGCPLNGSISHGTTGGGAWFCAHHFDTRPEDRDQVTVKIRANYWLIRFANRIKHIDPFEWDRAKPQAEAYVLRHNRADLLLQPDETRGKYVARLLGAFGVLVAATPVHRERRGEAKKPADGPSLLEELLTETA